MADQSSDILDVPAKARNRTDHAGHVAHPQPVHDLLGGKALTRQIDPVSTSTMPLIPMPLTTINAIIRSATDSANSSGDQFRLAMD